MDRRSLLAAPLLLPFAAGAAEPAFPTRPVTLVVAFPPGGQADVVARLAAPTLERLWHVAVPIVNRPGASGEIGNALADGPVLHDPAAGSRADEWPRAIL